MKKIVKAVLSILILSFVIFQGIMFSVNASGSTGESTFWIKFIDVGQGDAALIQCDGKYMLIDGGPSDASSVIYTFLKNSDINKLDYMIATHPDADHIGGLSGALNYAQVDKCYCPVTEHDTKTFNSLVKYLKKQGVSITIPNEGDKIKLGSANVTVLGPIGEISDSNNSSIVVKIEYGKNSFIFMGDAEVEEESQILKKNKNLNCDLIKIGHHGSESSTSKELLDAVNPKYAIISVGKDNSYGHPVQTILDRITAKKTTIYRTDLQGDITVVSDGKTISITTEKNANTSDLKTKEVTEVPSGTTYVLNTSSKRFHKIDCKSVNQMKESNRAYSTESAEKLVEQGYKPCGTCKPYVSQSVVNSNKSDNKSDSDTTKKTQGAVSTYVLNTNSKKFHLPSCGSVSDMSQKNRKDVSMTRDEVISSGYSPCKRCNP